MFIYNYITILVHSLLCFSTDDASRVILSVPDSDGNDYINASFIDVRINFQTYLSVGLRVQEYIWHIKIPLNSYIVCVTDHTY